MKHNSLLLEHFKRIEKETEPKLRWNARNRAAHRRWRIRFRRKLGNLLGRMPERVPLKVETTETRNFKAFTRKKIYIRSEKHYWIPAYLFIPRGLKKPVPAIVCLHGHSGIFPYIRDGSRADVAKSRELSLDFAPTFAEHGYVTLAPVQRGWNETKTGVSPSETGCQRMVLNSFLMNMTPIGLRCWDASRALDYLATLNEVDPSRIGAAGLSGGGMVGLFWSALEPRVRVALIAGYYCTFKESIYSIYHCLCNCVPGIMRWGDMREVAALIAPRPLLIISGTKDSIFPIKATSRAYRELQAVYSLLNASDRLDKDFFDGPHAWSNRKSIAFLQRHLGGRGR